jgi:Uma2 family endonuclease
MASAYPGGVRTVVLGARPPELEALLERRRALGQDMYDEVWAGDYHIKPEPQPLHDYVDHQLAELLGSLYQRARLVATGPFNLGGPDDYRVPDRGLHRGPPATTFVPTAAVVIEVVSPDDETWNKIDFYNAHSVDELLIADLAQRSVTLLAVGDGRYAERESSGLLGVGSAELAAKIDW